MPDARNMRDAWLEYEIGERILDFQKLNLQVLGYREPGDATLSREELLPHLHSLPDMPTVTPYLTSYYERRWGFLLPDDLKRSLPQGRSHAYIDATLQPGHLPHADRVIPAQTEEEVLHSFYVCH